MIEEWAVVTICLHVSRATPAHVLTQYGFRPDGLPGFYACVGTLEKAAGSTIFPLIFDGEFRILGKSR